MPPQRRHRRRPAFGRVDIQRPAPPRGSVSAPVRLNREQDGVHLAGRLFDAARQRPLVVVSVSAGRREPWIDVAAVTDAVMGLAEVVVLATDAASWALAEMVPPGAQVYGGAGRTYPPGLDWMTDLSMAPLRFAYTEQDAQRATELLIHDVLGMVAKAGGALAANRWSAEVAGVVKVLVPPSRALVELEDGGLATVWQELTVPSVPIDRLLRDGQTVRGYWDSERKRLDISGMRMDGRAWGEGLGRGDVVLTEVVEVRADVVHLALHPDLVVPVARDRVTSNPKDTLTSLFSEGEVVLARVAARDGDRIFLRLDDIDDDEEPLPAPVLLSGGPPWLTPAGEEPAAELDGEDPGSAEPGRDVSAEEPEPKPVRGRGDEASPHGVASGKARHRGSASTDVLAGRVRALERELDLLRAERNAADREAKAFTARSRELEERNAWLDNKVRHQTTALRREKLRSGRTSAQAEREGSVPESATSAPAFDDPVCQFRHEVYLEWAGLIPAGEKARRPLASYSLGPDFLASLEETQGVERAKVVRVVVEVLTGLAESLDGRDLHVLRSGSGGGAPPLMRGDGATAWRVALQRGTPAARRLHYWRRRDEVELSRVVTHDDMRP